MGWDTFTVGLSLYRSLPQYSISSEVLRLLFLPHVSFVILVWSFDSVSLNCIGKTDSTLYTQFDEQDMFRLVKHTVFDSNCPMQQKGNYNFGPKFH